MRRAAAGVIGALLLLLLWASLRPSAAPEDRALFYPAHPEGPPHDEVAPAPPNAADAAASEECDAERGELEARLRAATDDPACARDLLADGCGAELPHNAIFPTFDQVAADLDEALAACPAAVRRGVVLDCSEFPCMVLVRRDLLAAPVCMPLQQVADASRDQPPGDGIEATHVAVPATGRYKLGDHAPVVDARWEARKHVLARRFRNEMYPLVIDRPRCAEVRTLLEHGSDCEVVRQSRGCAPRAEPVFDPVAVADHLDAARALVDELERTCPTFRDRPHALDCTELPCVLAIDVTDTSQDQPVVVCDHPVWQNEDRMIFLQTHVRRQCGSTVIVPLWNLGDLRDRAPAVEEHYFSQREYRRSESCQAVERLRNPP